MSKKLWIGGAAGIVVLAIGAYFGYWQLIRYGYLKYNRYDRRERGSVRAGQQAPDVALTMYDGTPLRLSERWRRRPLYLVFGSCT